jgi:hypothetical protein
MGREGERRMRTPWARVKAVQRWSSGVVMRVDMWLGLVFWRQAIWSDFERSRLPDVPVKSVCSRELQLVLGEY